eukprot:CCRYP_003329-RA/>CCRYP_003329-RA protein AED:0.45 eAED:0.45 QI:110/-1/1/1/-1/1/1/0/131
MGVRDSRAVSTACAPAIHACKQMGLDTDFAAAEKAVETAKIEAELAKQEYVTVRNAEKKKKGNKQEAPATTTETASPALVEAKTTYDKVLKALEAAAHRRNGWSEALRALWKSPLRRGTPALGEDYKGPSD